MDCVRHIREMICGLTVANYSSFRDARTRLVELNFKIDDGNGTMCGFDAGWWKRVGRRAFRINSRNDQKSGKITLFLLGPLPLLSRSRQSSPG